MIRDRGGQRISPNQEVVQRKEAEHTVYSGAGLTVYSGAGLAMLRKAQADAMFYALNAAKHEQILKQYLFKT